MKTKRWIEIQPASTVNPKGRMHHVMIRSANILLMYGGYNNNFYFDDTWQFNTTSGHWLEKESYVWPTYPSSCSNDMAPNNANFSVWGQPTRGYQEFDVSDSHLFVKQKRRQKPGWDGCRDRRDGRQKIFKCSEGTPEEECIPNKLQWVHPSQRAGHSAIYSNKYQIMMIYGGYGNNDEIPVQRSITYPASTQEDFWQYNINACPSNCTLHGACKYGYCFCDDGYYGVDCSNVTCPGDFCHYDPFTHKQHCKHCCHATYQHFDGDQYLPDERKVPCSHTHKGVENGVCNGFGQCQCRPPFITEDCAVKDCAGNCSGHGWCSVEYPVSRCMCDPKYFGDLCEHKLCLNNCSWPNGDCILSEGEDRGKCNCSMRYNPYNRYEPYYKWSGTDCSWLAAYNSGRKLQLPVLSIALAVMAFSYLTGA